MTDVSDLAYKIIPPRFACVCDGLFIYELEEILTNEIRKFGEEKENKGKEISQ